jgi:hypothetical protein
MKRSSLKNRKSSDNRLIVKESIDKKLMEKYNIFPINFSLLDFKTTVPQIQKIQGGEKIFVIRILGYNAFMKLGCKVCVLTKANYFYDLPDGNVSGKENLNAIKNSFVCLILK